MASRLSIEFVTFGQERLSNAGRYSCISFPNGESETFFSLATDPTLQPSSSFLHFLCYYLRLCAPASLVNFDSLQLSPGILFIFRPPFFRSSSRQIVGQL